jgi:hypothetical protein
MEQLFPLIFWKHQWNQDAPYYLVFWMKLNEAGNTGGHTRIYRAGYCAL